MPPALLMDAVDALKVLSHGFKLCSTDTDTRIGIGPIQIRGYVIFPKNPIRGYVLVIFYKININAF